MLRVGFLFSTVGGDSGKQKRIYPVLLSSFDGKEIIYVGNGEPYPGLIHWSSLIQTPPQNAYSESQRILQSIEKQLKNTKNPIVVFSCGITATALSAEVNAIGVQALDVGLCFTKRLAAMLNGNG